MATEQKKDALQQPTGNMARPSFIEDSTAGTEGITADELKFPRLAIAQGPSPQLVPGDSAYIPGLTLFQMFNDLTKEIYGMGPMTLVVGDRRVKRIEFELDEKGRPDRKRPVDLEVPVDDPRMKWTKDPTTGKGVPPVAIKFVEFLSLIVHPDGRLPEPVVVSIQETNKFNRRAHMSWTGFIKMRQPPAPIYAGLYTMTIKTEKNDQGTFGVWVPENSGYITDRKLYERAKEFHFGIQGKEYTVDREVGADDFDPADLEDADRSGM